MFFSQHMLCLVLVGLGDAFLSLSRCRARVSAFFVLFSLDTHCRERPLVLGLLLKRVKMLRNRRRRMGGFPVDMLTARTTRRVCSRERALE